ncbi:MAG: fluoride efflux transporter CrcB [Phycisphaerales bacterium]|nr:fluoride efflux transporter CrcB [Phycisphaerales bacterium]
MLKLALIFVGSGTGGLLRYGLAGWVQHAWGATFPLGTLVVNVVGCLFVGFLGAALAGPILVREEYRVALLIGLLGGFTTFSTFGKETFALAGDREWMLASTNIVLSVGLGLLGVWLGTRLAESIFGD